MKIESIRDMLSDAPYINFSWVSLSQNGEVFDYAGIAVRAREKRTQREIIFQFDTGAKGSQLYEIALTDQLGVDFSTKRVNHEELVQLDLLFDGRSDQLMHFALRRDFGEQRGISSAAPEIGTLALDFFKGPGFMIDYPARRLYLLSLDELQTIEQQYESAFRPYLTSFKNISGKIILPICINGQDEHAIFDTGSSMFEMTLPVDLWKQVTCSSIETAKTILWIESWGKQIRIFGSPAAAQLKIAGRNLAISEAYTWPTYDMLPVIGNKLFLDNLIVIDRKKLLIAAL